MKPSREKRKVSDIVSDVSQVDGVTTPIILTEPWTVLAHKKPQKGWIAYNPSTMRPPPLTRDTKFVKLLSWNVNGLRALLKLEGFSALQLAQREDFDVLCLQETKLQVECISAQSLILCLETIFCNNIPNLNMQGLGANFCVYTLHVIVIKKILRLAQN